MADIPYICPQCGRRSPQPSAVTSVWCTGLQHKEKGLSVRMTVETKKDKNAQA